MPLACRTLEFLISYSREYLRTVRRRLNLAPRDSAKYSSGSETNRSEIRYSRVWVWKINVSKCLGDWKHGLKLFCKCLIRRIFGRALHGARVGTTPHWLQRPVRNDDRAPCNIKYILCMYTVGTEIAYLCIILYNNILCHYGICGTWVVRFTCECTTILQ